MSVEVYFPEETRSAGDSLPCRNTLETGKKCFVIIHNVATTQLHVHECEIGLLSWLVRRLFANGLNLFFELVTRGRV